MQLNIYDAKTQLSQLIERACSGEEIVIAKAGEPKVRLMPVAADQPRQPGIAEGAVTSSFFDALPDAELDAWE